MIHNIPKRTKTGRFVKGIRYSPATEFKKGQHWRPWQPFRDANWLKNEYIINQKSAKLIAKENNCTDTAIYFWLERHKIKRRTISEARKIQYWGVSGEDNPLWNKKGELSPTWKGGSTPERQAFYTSTTWKKTCSLIWKRDNATCQRCGITERDGVLMHIHHLISFCVRETRANPNNLLLLCKICHLWVHSKKNTKREFLGVRP
jgi:hypothetical protein